MPPNRKDQITDEQVVQAASELIKSGVSIESADLPEEMRARVRSLVSGDGGVAGPEAKKPPTREQLIDKLGLRDQWENRADHMAHLIGQDIFKLGKPIPTLEATLNSFTLEQLQLASTLQEPTLLLVPETSFGAKVAALDVIKTKQKNAYVHEVFVDSGMDSKNIKGWKAVIVEGAGQVKVKKEDDVGLEFAERIASRRASRRPSERGMDRHTYAMLMLGALGKGKPVDKNTKTLLDDDPAQTGPNVPYAFWNDGNRQVFILFGTPNYLGGYARFRSSVGGEVEL